jgi:UDP-N-acetylglucosamine 4,6-dehydratase
MIYDNKIILITGGTGSFGKQYLKTLLETKAKKIIIFSRDEFKQSNLKRIYTDDRIRWILGDVRNYESVYTAMKGVDIVVHAAALKQVDSGEYNPREFIATNINGALNVTMAAIECGVSKVVALSTDKAVEPINLYGMTKSVSDKTFINSNVYSQDTNFALVRYGNVANSRGSVIPFFKGLKTDTLPVTDRRMTRFYITLEQAVNTVTYALDNMSGTGETFISKCKSFAIVDLVDALGKRPEFIGIRPGEKLHEAMIVPTDRNVYETDKYYIVYPDNPYLPCPSCYIGEKVKDELHYDSLSNTDWFTVDELREVIK